ncbi:MAG TPA: O-antigen ligase family protein [Candidatus Binatia bacterium]|nr:O-antigen ligase family protein [Candidatus Binatia bacterium]
MADVLAVRGRATESISPGALVIALGGLALVAIFADILLGTGAWFFGIAGVLLLAGVLTRPELGIAVFLSTFLITYPQALQGTGFLTINNVLGLLFVVLMAHRVYITGDWWFLRNPELRILALIVACYYVSAFVNGPEPRLLQLIGVPEEAPDSTRLFVNRVAFVVFFINFIERPAHIKLIFLLAIGMIVLTTLIALWGFSHGTALHGYRAQTFDVSGTVQSAANPNRLALLAIIAVAALWYASQQIRSWAVRGVLFAFILVEVLAVLLSASRSGLVALLAGAAFIAFDEGVSIRKVVAIALAASMTVLLALWFVPEKNLERLENLPGTESAAEGVGAGSLARRSYTLELGEQIIRDNFFFGVGVGNWEITRYMNDPTHSTAAPHSSVLLAWVEGGVFCVLAFATLFWRAWQNLVVAQQRLPHRGEGDFRWIVKAARVAVFTLAAFSLVADLWSNIVLFWLVGLTVVCRRYAEQRVAPAV